MNCELALLQLMGGFVAASGLMMLLVGIASRATVRRGPNTLWGNSGTTRRAIGRFALSLKTKGKERIELVKQDFAASSK